MSRIGKIARLPKTVREKLNLRLEDNEPAKEILEWLNGLPQTQKVLKSLFNGAPINKQNLSSRALGQRFPTRSTHLSAQTQRQQIAQTRKQRPPLP
jgi:hypothetical protein